MGVCISGLIIASIAVGLRLYSRRKFHIGVKADDWLAVVALVSLLAETAPKRKDGPDADDGQGLVGGIDRYCISFSPNSGGRVEAHHHCCSNSAPGQSG